MPPFHTRPPFNPSVEEVRDETENLTSYDATPSDSGSSWPELCAQHESVLSSHLKTLRALQEQLRASSDPEGSKLVSSMVERTNKLCVQFETVKKHIIPRIQGGVSASAWTARTPPDDSYSSRSSSKQDDLTGSKRRKRARRSNDNEPKPELGEELLPEALPLSQRSKRKRMDLAIPGSNEDVRNAMPVALETEDISDEVQRRLKIKEEQRKKRETDVKPGKRKRDRDSLASNGSSSSLSLGVKPRKKFKLGERANG
ncbi:hypothetical protein ASPCAL11981 [Aspergillus calidoustus]|uniref:Uncharacterized protein n=1 Tax=Aspergillus calidoustus TaxID=454130 RepID=A0A0U5H4K0_ASPCI|nr:hypothetical protein ASPCAL11981 [Aspergillus calidoustus]